MEETALAITSLILIIVFTLIGIPIAYSIGFFAVVSSWLLWGAGGLAKAGDVIYSNFFHLQWTPLPLFVLLAAIINVSKIGEDIFKAVNKWLGSLRGGVVISAIFAEAVMAAAIGSSTLTLLTVGKVAQPEVEKLGYKRDFSAAAITCGGIMGPLIPPSIPLIVYGLMAEQSIARLFMAGMMPGIILTFMLAATVIVFCYISPEIAPKSVSYSWRERFSSIWRVWPIVVVLVSIIGGLYLGIVTAGEAAALGSIVALIIGIVFYQLRIPGLFLAIKETAITTGMILIMIISVKVLTYMVGSSGLAQELADAITASNLGPWMVIVLINILLLILGCFVDGVALMLLTLPFFLPIVRALGFDLIWFGVVISVNIEIGLLTPPIGLNLFIARTAFNVTIGDLVRKLLPFFIVSIVFLFIIVFLPSISLWLPGLLF